MPIGKPNAEWHASHPMPPHATLDQRVAWHLEHQEHCGCRGLPASVRKELERRARERRPGNPLPPPGG